MNENELLTPRERAALDRNPQASLASEPIRDDELRASTPLGVGGFLAFLVAILVVIGPLFSALMTYTQHQELSHLYPGQLDSSAWRMAQVFDWSVWLLSSILSIGAGLLLAKRFQRSTVWLAIALIWFSSVGVGVLSLFAAEWLFSISITAIDVGSQIGRALIFSLVWSGYLLISKRVRNTYV